ncbi:MAG TPA: hypothetical protein VJQ77_05925 [Novosphingobium sp.]|nr:hypothetical protein [Novosphingobium sp.]
MTRPPFPRLVVDNTDLRTVQAGFDAEGRVLHAARRQTGAPPLIVRWQDTWHEAPAEARRDIGCLVCMTVPFLAAFALVWTMLP